MLNDAAVVMSVADIARSLAWYRDALGFDLSFQYGEPTFYVCLCRDNVSIHLIAQEQARRTAGQGALCVFVSDVDALYEDFVRRGANIPKPPQDYDYGMRDFLLYDPDGNQLTFGMASGDATQDL
jgi:catechol 2,3-dioxygenase-like lactoylglutathione lyase family enzyme